MAKKATKAQTKRSVKSSAKHRNAAVTPTKAPKSTTERKGAKTPKMAGAIGSMQDVKEITVTKNKISVTRERSVNEQGKYTKHTTREYHDITPEAVKVLNQAANSPNVKKITVQMKR